MDIDAWLKDLKVPREAYRIVALLPLVYVAWADGRVQPAERRLIVRIATERGLLAHGGEYALERWLADPPSRQQLASDLAALNELAHADCRPDGEFGADDVQLLLAWCQDVADAAGGLFGLKSPRTDAETAALQAIASALDLGNARQWRALIKG